MQNMQRTTLVFQNAAFICAWLCNFRCLVVYSNMQNWFSLNCFYFYTAYCSAHKNLLR